MRTLTATTQASSTFAVNSNQPNLPSATSAPSYKSTIASAETRAETAIAAAIGQKAYDVRGVKVGDVSDVADYFVIASGTSDRHVMGIADKIKDALQKQGETPVSTVGYTSAEWIVLDYGDLVIHIFYEPTRQYYDFDRLWGHAPELNLPAELEAQQKRLRTGMVQLA